MVHNNLSAAHALHVLFYSFISDTTSHTQNPQSAVGAEEHRWRRTFVPFRIVDQRISSYFAADWLGTGLGRLVKITISPLGRF